MTDEVTDQGSIHRREMLFVKEEQHITDLFMGKPRNMSVDICPLALIIKLI